MPCSMFPNARILFRFWNFFELFVFDNEILLVYKGRKHRLFLRLGKIFNGNM